MVGQDYPAPIVDHDSAREANMEKMKLAYADTGGDPTTGRMPGETSVDSSRPSPSKSKRKPSASPKSSRNSTAGTESIDKFFKKKS